MAGKRPFLTSTDLIDSVKNTISVPLVQQTFSNQNLLDFATQELFLSQVPSILQYHEEYFVTGKTVALEENVSNYPIPDRAIGMKLRDLFYVDVTGATFEMVNIGPSNSDAYRNTNNGNQTPRYFYMEGNDVVLVPDVKNGVTGSLLMKYYFRPNSLVENERAAISNSFVKLITIDNTILINGNTLSIGSSVLTAGTDFAIGASSIATATNISTVINNISGVTATSNAEVVTVFYSNRSRTFTTNNEVSIIIDSEIGIRCDSIPEHFEDGMKVDILQTAGGHNTLSFDVIMEEGSVSSDTLFFPADTLPTKFVIGDYICEQHECIIPQIPSDLHMLLVQRTCSRVLDALGDKEGAQTQMSKISDLEARQAVILDNRVEGAPRKIFNRHSLLRLGKSRRIGNR